jgi:hypothetical protein
MPETLKEYVMSLGTHTYGNFERTVKVESWQVSITTGVTSQ